MNQEKAKEWIPLFQAVAGGRILQRVRSDGHTYGTEWFDVQEPDIDLRLPISCYRLKPREFKNFALPWDFIEKRWNYATYARSHDGIIVYESRPTFFEEYKTDLGRVIYAGWRSELSTWYPIIPTQEGINTTEWLACRNEN